MTSLLARYYGNAFRNVPVATKVPKVTETSLRSRDAPPPYPFNCITSPTSRGVHTIHGRLLGLLRRLVTDYSCKSHNGCSCIWRACDHIGNMQRLTSHPLIKSTIDGMRDALIRTLLSLSLLITRHTPTTANVVLIMAHTPTVIARTPWNRIEIRSANPSALVCAQHVPDISTFAEHDSDPAHLCVCVCVCNSAIDFR